MIGVYKKVPVTVKALQWTGRNDEEVEKFIGDWFLGYVNNCVKFSPTEQYKSVMLKLKTLEGVMYASIGDYIIEGVDGEFYPCKPDIFEQTYSFLGFI